MNGMANQVVELPPGVDRLMSLAEVAACLRTSRMNVSKLLGNGRLASVWRGRARFVRMRKLNEFMETLDGQDLEELYGKECEGKV